MPLDVRGQNYRSIFQQQIHFLISKPQHNRSPSVKRQTWTITISTEKRQTFVGLLFLTELPSKSFPWWKFLQETEAKSQHFQMQRCRMSHLVLPVTLNSPSQAGHAVVLLFVLLSNSSLAPCCRLVDKAEKRMVKQRSHVFGWDDTPQTVSKMITYFFVCLLEHDEW